MVKMIRDNTGRFAERPFYRERDGRVSEVVEIGRRRNLRVN